MSGDRALRALPRANPAFGHRCHGAALGQSLMLVLLCAHASSASAQASQVDSDPAAQEDVAADEGATSDEPAAGAGAEGDPAPEPSDEADLQPTSERASTTRRPSTHSTRMRFRARHDMLVRWAPRYRLEAGTTPIGLEQEMWRRIEVLPMYHRVSLDVRNLADGRVSLHLSGWGALDLFADSDGGVAAGDIAIAYADVQFEPVTLWVGRRFVTYGPPGGLHVDGGGASVRTDFGLIAEAFVGRPVTPTRNALLGPQTSFQGVDVAYGARVGYSDPGRLGLSSAFTETWGRGIVASRILDSVAYWYPGEFRVEGALKLDLVDVGVLQGQLTALWRPAREVDLDVGFSHLEPGRWIPRWSILSVFETSTYDELAIGGTWRPTRPLAFRLVASGRRYDRVQSEEADIGYRVALYTRITPSAQGGPRLRVVVDRRDDGVLGYTILQAGVAIALAAEFDVGLDGSFAIDDAMRRESILGRVSGDYRPSEEWTLGVTVSVARTPISPAEVRALLRARWAESS